MIKSAGIDFVNIQPEEPDHPLGTSSGAGAIFGVTGGVMEAAIRTAYELYTGQTLLDIEVENVRGLKGIKEGKLEMDGKEIRVAVAHGLGNACKLLDTVRNDPDRYHFVEIMGCPGGCVGGGGQPYATINTIPLDDEALTRFRWTMKPSSSGLRPCILSIAARPFDAAMRTRTFRNFIRSFSRVRSVPFRINTCIRTIDTNWSIKNARSNTNPGQDGPVVGVHR
jgi:hypothetical protein